MSHWLNPRLTDAECIEISRMKTAGFCELCDSLTKNVQSVADKHGKQAAIEYFNQMYPLILQQYALAMM